MKRAGCIVVFVARPAAVRARARIGAAVCAVCASGRRPGMICVPEQPAVEDRFGLLSVVDIDVNVVAGRILHQTPPTTIPAAHEIEESAVNEVILIVVMRNEWTWPAAMDRFVVRIQFA